MNKTQQTACIKSALCVIGDKWSPLILKVLMDRGSARFSDIEDALPGLSPRTLSQRLERLETQEIIFKDQYCQAPVRCEYRVTPKGEELLSVFKAMADWGEKYPSAA